MAERDDFGAFLIGFVIGGLTGAVTALLLAPQSGEETRTFIKEKSIELKDVASERLDEIYAQAETTAMETKARFDQLAETTKDKAVELQKKGQVLLEEQRSKLSKKSSDSDSAVKETPDTSEA